MARYLLLAFLLALTGAQDTSTELKFCTICKCTPVSNDEKSVDVDCTNHNVKNYLYEESFWQEQDQTINSLNVQYNDLRELATQFRPSNLTKLDLSNNSIISIGEFVFSNLENMEELILSNNDLSILTPESFRGLRLDARDYPLKAMKIFRVAHNQLHTLNQDLFEHLDNLEVLDISYNPFTVIDQPTLIAISSLPYLKELDMSYTQIKQLPENFLHTPKYLTVLDLSGNNFNYIPVELADSHDLQVFYFNNNPIENLTYNTGFPVVASIKTVHLCDMPKLRYVGNGSLSGLHNLEELHMANNIELMEIHESALSRRENGEENEIWPPLKKVHLQNNKLTSLDYHLILKWEALSELDIRDNPWTCDCENQWLVDDLMPAYIKINDSIAKTITCAAPSEMKGKTLYELYMKQSEMRCLDIYGNHPEKDAPMLVGLLAGLLLGIPLVLLLAYAYQRNCFSVRGNSPASFSRNFYSRTNSDDINF